MTFTSVLAPSRGLRQSSPDLRARADEELMALAADGEARAFEVIFDRHGDAAFSLAYRMCGRRAIAEDVVQEAFLSLWRSGARYERARERPLVGPKRRAPPSDRRVPPRNYAHQPRHRR